MQKRPDLEATFRVLIVCTGNICRSPFGEILARHLVTRRMGDAAAAHFLIGSAGVQAVVGSGMHPATRKELAPWGLQGMAEGFVARQLVPAMLTEADLVLGASTRHRAAAVRLAPKALPVTFSLREFARLACSVDPDVLPAEPFERARALVHTARSFRGMVPPSGADADEVPDPVGRSAQAHRDAARLIAAALDSIITLMVPPLR